MQFTEKNIKLILATKDEFRLCNKLIFLTFFKKIKSLDFNKIDLNESKLSIIDENGKELNSSVFNKNNGYYIKIVSKNNTSINLEIDLWDSIINIYIGKELSHFADDVNIDNQKKLLEFNKYFSLLLESKITEELQYKGRKLKKLIYNFHADNSSFVRVIGFPLLFKKIDNIVSKDFIPWIS